MLKHRIITALIGIPLMFLLLYLGSYPLLSSITIVYLLGMKEFINISKKAGSSPLCYSMYLGGYLLILEAFIFKGEYSQLILYIVFVLIFLEFLYKKELNMVYIAVSLLGVLYLGLFKYILLLRNLPNGFLLISMAFILTWMVDTGAYFTGRYFGRRKLAPSISPNKTLEGSIGGIIITVFSAFIINHIFIHIGIFNAVLLGLLVSFIGQIGDLFESLLKRGASIKDSGAIFPGHGGVLDRFDSILFTIPIAYYFIIVFKIS